MPLPKPRETESHGDFISRCHSEIAEEYDDQKQRHAVCEGQWRKEHDGETSDSRAQADRGFQVVNKDSVSEVYIYDMIGAGFFGGGVTAASFRDDLSKAKNAKTLNIYINSPGGDFFEAAAIHAQLVRHKARKVIYIDGLAASAASLIAMAGEERHVAANAMVMVHDPWAGVIGTVDDMERMATALGKIKGQMVAEYTRATGQEAETIGAMMSAETWLTAQEAIEHGFAHELDAELAVAASVLKQFDLSLFQYRNPPVTPEGAIPKGDTAALLIRPALDRAAKALGYMQIQLPRRAGMTAGPH